MSQVVRGERSRQKRTWELAGEVVRLLLVALAECHLRGDTIRVDTTPILTRREWRLAVLMRDQFRCRWCGAATSLCAHHIRQISHYPCAELELDNGLTLCWQCHYYEAHNGWPHYVHGRYSRTRRPYPGQLELFGRWPGTLFGKARLSDSDNLITPPIGSVWPGPQRLLFPVAAGLFAGVR